MLKHGIHYETGQEVAIKIVKKTKISDKSKLSTKFRKEIALQRIFSHPNVLKIYKVIETESSLYLVLEKLSKELFTYIVENEIEAKQRSNFLFQQLIFGLEYIHSFCIVHRDLKPENLLLDDNLNLKIADFGMAQINEKKAFLETACGSPHYVAPEILQGEKYNGAATDVWSCGVILFALLTGSLPFDQPTYSKLIQSIINCRINFQRFTLSELAKDLVLKMLTVDPKKRITISEIKEHPWFLHNIPKGCELPTPKNKLLVNINKAYLEGNINQFCLNQLEIIQKKKSKALIKELKKEGENKTKILYQILNQTKKDLEITNLKENGKDYRNKKRWKGKRRKKKMKKKIEQGKQKSKKKKTKKCKDKMKMKRKTDIKKEKNKKKKKRNKVKRSSSFSFHRIGKERSYKKSLEYYSKESELKANLHLEEKQIISELNGLIDKTQKEKKLPYHLLFEIILKLDLFNLSLDHKTKKKKPKNLMDDINENQKPQRLSSFNQGKYKCVGGGLDDKKSLISAFKSFTNNLNIPSKKKDKKTQNILNNDNLKKSQNLCPYEKKNIGNQTLSINTIRVKKLNNANNIKILSKDLEILFGNLNLQSIDFNSKIDILVENILKNNIFENLLNRNTLNVLIIFFQNRLYRLGNIKNQIQKILTNLQLKTQKSVNFHPELSLLNKKIQKKINTKLKALLKNIKIKLSKSLECDNNIPIYKFTNNMIGLSSNENVFEVVAQLQSALTINKFDWEYENPSEIIGKFQDRKLKIKIQILSCNEIISHLIRKIIHDNKISSCKKYKLEEEYEMRTVLHSQLLYGLEIFDLTKTDFKDIDTWINKKITKFLLINPHSPLLIYKTEAKIDPKKKSENINWYSKNLKQLENELENFRIKNLENSPSWKVQEYLKIVQINNTINKQQRYLKWKGSTSILKLRNFTNYLNRYSYVMNKNKSKLCELCKKINNLDIIEDLDHFLWNCSAYENNRKIWISELKKINISNILNNNNISNIIIKKDSNSLLALVGNKLIFESLIKFLNKNLGIRANKRGQ
ncbi:protein kinase [Anaeramoeba flamelloides]|uniref:Protein kinase n=1 Tax=Anaeramoeba flamelloides TaxID=1746091 RepID=A0AAV7ZTD6_9EUKA|nr:protein kinase [Anaeramoeba flamelloides]